MHRHLNDFPKVKYQIPMQFIWIINFKLRLRSVILGNPNLFFFQKVYFEDMQVYFPYNTYTIFIKIYFCQSNQTFTKSTYQSRPVKMSNLAHPRVWYRSTEVGISFIWSIITRKTFIVSLVRADNIFPRQVCANVYIFKNAPCQSYLGT